jgi:hypothetical protein
MNHSAKIAKAKSDAWIQWPEMSDVRATEIGLHDPTVDTSSDQTDADTPTPLTPVKKPTIYVPDADDELTDDDDKDEDDEDDDDEDEPKSKGRGKNRKRKAPLTSPSTGPKSKKQTASKKGSKKQVKPKKRKAKKPPKKTSAKKRKKSVPDTPGKFSWVSFMSITQ